MVLPHARLRQLGRSTRVVRHLVRIFERERPDLIVSWLTKAHLYAGPAAMRAGMRDRLAWLQYDFPGRGGPADRAATALPTRAIIACSNAVAVAQRGELPYRPTITVTPGIDAPRQPSGERVAQLRRELGLSDGRPVVGIVGRLLPWKGQDRFVEAIALLRQRGADVQALVVGGNAYDLAPGFDDAVRLRARELGVADSIVFTGQVPNGSEHIAVMDVFVNASTPEPFGIVLLEAMAAGVPVVAVDAGGPAEIVEDGRSGVLAASGSPRDLAAAIEPLIADPDLARTVGDAGRVRFADHFTAARMAAEMQAALVHLAAPR
jgi:glycosyltransferase involved in cell wall biosynthesis